jgi:hypothetical protein
MVAQNTNRYIDCSALIVLDDNGRYLIVIEDNCSLFYGNKATFTHTLLQLEFSQEEKSPANRACVYFRCRVYLNGSRIAPIRWRST